MLGRRSEIAHLQSDFYRDKLRKTLRWLFFSIVIIYVLLFSIIYMILVQPDHKYYANTTTGKIISMPKAAVD